jgi:hypothetical protein
MSADLRTSFRIVDGKIVLDRSYLTTDGAESEITGEVDLARWPEQTYQIQSQIQLPKMREIFWANDTFPCSVKAAAGTFHLFREQDTRAGRDHRQFSACSRDQRFSVQQSSRSVRWVPESLEVTNATAGVYGGAARFGYRMAPLGQAVRATATFDAEYEQVDLTTFTDFLETEGIRLAGRASGRNVLEWPLGRYAEHRGNGAIRVEPPGNISTLTREMSAPQRAEAERRGREWGEFSNHLPRAPVPLRAQIGYTYGPEWIDIAPSRLATPDTYVELEGRTAYGDRSRIDFHVTSADWQESDRTVAGVLTAFGLRTGVIPVGGHGTFDGVMVDSVRRPRIEGRFAGEQMRAFDVVWGPVAGRAVIQNSYTDVSDVVVGAGGAMMRVDGRFSLGFPRADGGEEINARIRLVGWPMTDLRHASSSTTMTSTVSSRASFTCSDRT